MKNKIFTLLSLSVLALVMIAGMASAAVLSEWTLISSGSASNVNTNINAGNFDFGIGLTSTGFDPSDGAEASDWSTGAIDAEDYFQITLSPKTGYELTISDLKFSEQRTPAGPTNYEIRWSKNTDFSDYTSIGTYTSVETPTSQAIPTSISVDEEEIVYMRFFGYNAGSGIWRIDPNTLSIEGNVEEIIEPEEITKCSTTGNPDGDLQLEIRDITAYGLGKDKEWYAFDEIEVEIRVENDNDDDKIKEITVGWGLYNTETEKWYIDEEENDFRLKEGEREELTIKFNLDDDIDDLADYADNYILYVWANGILDADAGETPICASASDEEVEIQVEDDFIFLNNIQYIETASCGRDVQITANVWNIGSEDQDEVYVVIKNTELGIDEKILIGDINAYDDEKISASVSIPEDAEEKTYTLIIYAYNEYDELFQLAESDFDDEAAFPFDIKVEGGCATEPKATVSASLESEAKAGSELVIKATIINTGVDTSTFEISAADFSGWATLVSTVPESIVLGVGDSEEVMITLNVNSGVSGDQSFNILVTEGGKVLSKQIVIEDIGKTGFSGFTGNFLAEGSWPIWTIGAINVVLIFVIILVALKVAKK